MRRSRQSLSFLLAMMALSLSILRATSTPSRPTAPAPTSRAPSPPRPRIAASKAQVGFRPIRQEPVVKALPPKRCPVRASRLECGGTIIVILPQLPDDDWLRNRRGWSGCTAFAHGCDHLGRPCFDRPAGHTSLARLFIRVPLWRLMNLAAHASIETAKVLCKSKLPERDVCSR